MTIEDDATRDALGGRRRDRAVDLRESLARPIRTSARAPRKLASSLFRIVPEGAARRRPSDLVRAVVAALLVLITALATRDVSGLEESVYEFFASVPSALDWALELVYAALPATMVAIVVATLLSRRWRLGLSVALAAAGAFLAGTVLDAAVTDATSDALARAGIDLSASGAPEYPPLLLAVASAAVLAAAPYLTRPARKLLRALVVLAALSAVVLVVGLPVAVIGALTLAWGVAALVQLALGTPAGTPSLTEVAAALDDLGIECGDLALAEGQVWGEARFVGVAPDGDRLLITVLGRDAIDAGFYSKVLRFIWYKDSGPTLILSREQQVEHRAYLLLLAERTGARLTEVVGAGTAGAVGHALLVTLEPPGRPLATLDPAAITDDVLDDMWRNLARLHQARLAHGNVSLDNVFVDHDGTTALVDLSRSSTSAPGERMARDGAELLAGTAVLLGAPRAVAAAVRNVSHEHMVAILPLLQTTAMSREVLRSLGKAKPLLAELRKATAEQLGEPEPELPELRRVSPGNLAMAAGAALGVYLLLGELADVQSVGDVFTDPNWFWLVICFAVSQTPQLGGAIAMLGSVAAPLPLGPTTAVQFANNFTGLVGGTVANTALVVRYFQKQGLAPAVAVTSGILHSVASMVTQAVLIVVGLAIYGGDFSLADSGGDGGSSSTAGIIILALAAVVGAVLLVPRLRRRVNAKLRPQFVAARDNLRLLWSSPTKALQLFGGNVASQLLFALTLQAALLVYGDSLPLMQLVLINSFASLIGGVAPVPGGMGVIEAGLISGFTAAGVPETTAIAATFTARAFTAYLPPIWGWFSMQWLRHHDYL